MKEAQDLCSKYSNCAGVTKFTVKGHDRYEPRFGKPEELAEKEFLPTLWKTDPSYNVMSWKKDKSDKCIGGAMNPGNFEKRKKTHGRNY